MTMRDMGVQWVVGIAVDVAVGIAVSVVIASVMVDHAHAMSTMFRPAWADEVDPAMLSRWFDFVAAGRAQGEASPYYLNDIVLQNTACNQLNPLGPPCNASAPTHSKQAKGNHSMHYGQLFESALTKLQPHLDHFDTVYVGTLWLDGWNSANLTSNTEAAKQQAKVAINYLGKFDRDNLAWYITMEGPLDAISFDHRRAEGMADFLNKTMHALRGVRELPVLWSPYWQQSYDSYNASAIAQIRAGMKKLFCGLSSDIAVHFQDCLGQTVTFEFPFYYNYSAAWTCTGHSVPFYRLLADVQKECPRLREVKINMELFAEHLHDGMRGENNGAFIVTASPQEVGQRLQCYKDHGAQVGACWALPHWYALYSQANQTIFHPY